MTQTACGNITVTDRKNIELTGVVSVDCFDEYVITLTVQCGTLTVEGEGLKLNELDLDRGRVTAVGRINAVYYSEQSAAAKGGVLSRIFGKRG